MNVSKIDLELFLLLDRMLWAHLFDTLVEVLELEQLFASYWNHSPLLVFDSTGSMNENKWKKNDCHQSFYVYQCLILMIRITITSKKEKKSEEKGRVSICSSR